MIDKILKDLDSLSEQSYKEFNQKLIPTKTHTLGVRLPLLRKIAKDIVKNEDIYEFLNSDKRNIYELLMLEGLVISYLKEPFTQLLPYIEAYLQKVDNWALIDSPFMGFKTIEKEKNQVLDIVKLWLKSKEEFKKRAGLVILLAFYVQEENLNLLFDLLQEVDNSEYYVYMANAWLISVCMAKFPKQSIEFFKNNTLDKKTHNKAIQKSKESFRVSKEDKTILGLLKK